MSATDNKTEITLKGSVDIVSEFFFTAINSILYQRGIYQPETFKRESKYGLTVLTSTDEGLLKYLSQVMAQVEAWLLSGDVQRLVVVVTGVDSGETLERWQFNVSLDEQEDGENAIPNNGGRSSKSNKSMKEIHGEIQAIIRQITASVTFLPLLNEPCSFDLLVYTKKEAAVPAKWEDSDPCYIMNSQEVKLRSFTTSVHKVDSMVTYRERDEWEL
ncbi:HORMA domain containing protein [Nitzschia inconspicua]|uniref:HORMA domain containing protein n=1 Tax=Nitzschia inconspicua TaxID=303405 RepID=A0A9K3L7F8_9STRA|nr:HORMA domain containing protein [Nitzschia inconspicua]